MIAAIPRTASIVLVPVTSFAGYATYVRSTAKPAEAHVEYMKNYKTLDESVHKKWRQINNGLGLVDVGRSGGGL
ncbi:hypothetical protein G6F37_004982 [Rhizopus arrhizus]|nr:hypothetical protein G6F38_004314 [Rhizopus arrhizus]KAG1159353.1 hypothetical protein G6F37_004982 [Rhizopus arrhizus]